MFFGMWKCTYIIVFYRQKLDIIGILSLYQYQERYRGWFERVKEEGKGKLQTKNSIKWNKNYIEYHRIEYHSPRI